MCCLSAETLAHLQSLCALFVEAKPRVRDQVSRAYDLVVSESVWPSPFFDGAVVALGSDGVTEYEVDANLCSCQAFERGKLCYHRIARRLFKVAHLAEARQEAQRVAAAARTRLTRKPSLHAGLGARTKTLHDLNAKRAAALPLASVTPIRRHH